MGSPSELSLDFKPNSFSTLLKSFGDDQTQKMEEFLARLEEERLKIDAFKRELPLCMQLLNNAMEAYRQQLENCQTVQGSRPILEEFIPLKIQRCDESDQKPADPSEKANWMTSVPLWSQASSEGSKHQAPTNTPLKGLDNGLGDGPKLALDNKQRNGGAFLPFSKERNMCANSNIPALPDLALASVDKENENKRCLESGNGLMPAPRREICNKSAGGTTEHGRGTTLNNAEGQTTTTASTTQTQAQRKARRCWSPDLHRRFVNALQMLGGSQVATPKQIRELMKVDGLTNDEVKSHLQKYRLHTRRPGPTPPAPATPGPHLVFLGGILVPPEFAAATHGAAPAIYGAHLASHASTPYCPPTVQQEFYPPAPAPPPHHPLHHHHYNAYNRASSQARSSPETDARVAGERSESIEEEEGKSESGSWKGGGAEGEKGLLPLRDEGAEEDSNGSDITLKF